MRRLFWPMLLALVSQWLSPRLALAQGKPRAAPARPAAVGSALVSLRVVDVADDRAYLEPGSDKGLRAGDEVAFGANKFKIVAVSASSAVVALAGKPLAIGSRGSVSVLSNRPDRVVLELTKPVPLARLRGELRAVEPPALGQHPEPVPLATPRKTKNRATLNDVVYAALPLGDGARFTANELRGRVHYEPFLQPLALDLDLALQSFAGEEFSRRPGAAARQLLRVRELALSYGAAAGFRGALGRLRAASAFVGQLDGARVEAPLSEELRLRAFAGTAPHTFNGMVSDQVGRFGGELVYQNVGSGLRPRLLLGGHASRFGGALDEKKAYASFDLLPPRSRIGGHAELSFFDPGNPWRASTTELTSAGLDANFEVDVFHFGGRLEMRRPDRSRWLASLLPAEWLCWADPAAAQAPCLPADASYQWLLDSGARVGKFSVDLGGQSRFTRGTDATNFGAFASVRWLDVVGRLHVDAGMSAFTGSVVRSTALVVAPGLGFWQGNADVSLRYRPALVRYRADLRSNVEHSLGGACWLSPSEAFDVDLEGDWTHGRDVNALALQAALSWRLGL